MKQLPGLKALKRPHPKGEPQHHCNNCGCNRYNPCGCMLSNDKRRAEYVATR